MNYTSEAPPIHSQSDTNGSTDTALLFSDLNSSTPGLGQPYQYANLSKPAQIPSVSGGILWPDEVNKCFYQFGGAFTNGTPNDFGVWTYDVLLDQWNQTESKGTGVSPTQRVAYGAGTHIEGLGLGFYFGGWMSNQTNADWTGHAVATSDLVRFEYSTGFLSNNSGPDDNVGRAEGQMVYLPVSDSGLLVYFGGIEDQLQNGTAVPVSCITLTCREFTDAVISGKYECRFMMGRIGIADCFLLTHNRTSISTMSLLPNGTPKLPPAAFQERADSSAQGSLGLMTSLHTICEFIQVVAKLE